MGGIVHDGKLAQEGLKAYEGEIKLGNNKDRKRKLAEWDKMLKEFRYGDAMDSVLRRVSTFFFTFVDVGLLGRRSDTTSHFGGIFFVLLTELFFPRSFFSLKYRESHLVLHSLF